MPTYEYHCDSCEKNFDVVQAFHDDPLTACPTCGSPVRKVFGNVGIVFKGSGFYKTDSRPGDKSKSPAAESGSDGTPGSDSSGSESSSSGSESSTPAAAPSGDGGSKSSTSEPGGTSATPPAPTPAAATSAKDSGA